MPTPGFFILHSRIVPQLEAGDYTLQATQEVVGGPTEPYTGHIRVTSARYTLPPGQILSIFPPANSEGAYESRLPQIVIRRRTLPWERKVDAAREIPWMALVVIAEGEGQLSGDTPVKDCVTPGVNLDGPNDVATGLYLAISQTVVNKVFPTKDDLQLLAHVREVDLNDTELALGDDDGFLAVVMANRLPQYDRVNCKPVRYMACLINLEGQLDVLPPPEPEPKLNFNAVAFVQDARLLAANANLTTDHFVMGQGVKLAAGGGNQPAQSVVPPKSIAGQSSIRGAIAQSWSATQASINHAAVSAAPAEAGRVVRDAMTEGFRFPLELYFVEKTYRFPVLAHWSFTCTGAGSFQTLVQGLDTGLLGTLPADPAAAVKPDCTPPQKGDAPPPTAPPRPAPEVTETGHVGLPHLTRRGDELRAWYRGPFTLHVTERAKPEADGHLPLAHTSDQLRRIVPDGREDLALAAAFEIGRLLALSQNSVVAALMRWRREQFGAERARQIAAAAMSKVTLVASALKGSIEDLGRLVGKQVITAAAKGPDKVLAPNRPLADPGRPMTYLAGNLDQIIADGFGFSLQAVRAATTVQGVITALNKTAVPQASGARFDTSSAASLKTALSSAVDELAAGAVGGKGVTRGPGLRDRSVSGREPEADALDQLLESAARDKEKT